MPRQASVVNSSGPVLAVKGQVQAQGQVVGQAQRGQGSSVQITAVKKQSEGHSEGRKSLVLLGPARTEDAGITEAEATVIDKALLTELTPVPPPPPSFTVAPQEGEKGSKKSGKLVVKSKKGEPGGGIKLKLIVKGEKKTSK